MIYISSRLHIFRSLSRSSILLLQYVAFTYQYQPSHRKIMSASSTDEAGNLSPEEPTPSSSSSSSSITRQCQYNNNTNSISEIEEENSNEFIEINHGLPMESIKEEQEESLFSLDAHNGGEDCVYVGVGKSESSLDALSWALRNAVNSDSTTVCLIHVFPEIHHIPSPLGKLPKSQVSAQQVESYMAQERGKRRETLQKFLNMCSASKVKADTVLIESDMVGKAMLDLIPILNVRKLVLGTSKSSLRKLRARKGSGIADQVLQNAPNHCEIKIICNGKEALDQMSGLADDKPIRQLQEQPINDSFACMCFKQSRVR